MANAPATRDLNLDLVKVCAMFGVLSLHSNIGRLDLPAAFIMSRLAGISIPLFFMVSGWLLWGRRVDYAYSMRKMWGIVRFCTWCCLFYWLFFDLRQGAWPTEVIHDLLGGFIQRGHFFVFWYFGAMLLLYLLLPLLGRCDTRWSSFGTAVVVAGALAVSLFFMANVACGWEERVNQTLRLWNWLFYFALGGLLRRVRWVERLRQGVRWVRLGTLAITLIMAVIFVFFARLMYSRVSGIEYYFGSVPCVAYAVAAFLGLMAFPVGRGRWVTFFAQLFLPVYAMHWWVMVALRGWVDTSWAGALSPVVDWALLAVVTCLLAAVVVRLPYVNRIFRI